MGEYDHELVELASVNLFNEVINGCPNLPNQICFRGCGYKHVFFPKINVKRNPDVLLYNDVKKIAIQVELKGCNSVDDDHYKQLASYDDTGVELIEDFIKERLDLPYAEIRDSITCIVYPKATLEKCYQSETCKEIISKMRELSLVCCQEAGETFNALNPEFVQDDDLLEIFSGITISMSPFQEYLLVENPCMKGVIFGIKEYIKLEFIRPPSLREQLSIKLTPNDLKDIFFYSRAKIHKFRRALDILKEWGYCNLQGEFDYTFTQDDADEIMRREDEIKEKIEALNCEIDNKKRKQHQKNLIDFR